MSCILSTLHFVKDLAAKREVTPVLTFHQPLYWKAQAILSQTDDRLLQNIVLRLGGFHLIMSFSACIGHLMAGSGLQEAFETIFAESSVPQILSGKAISRAIRGNNFVQAALFKHLINTCVVAKTSDQDKSKNACVKHSLRVFHQVQTWISFETQLPPTEWGWELKENGILWPIYTTKPLAPEDLLKIIKCGCKGDCNTNRCVCYKNGLSCSDICQTCRGISCSNGESATISEEDDV